MEVPQDKLKFIKENKLLILILVVSIFIGIFLIRLVMGSQNCNIVKLKGGVVQRCDCAGLEVTVKSTTSSGEQKTVCIGRITNKVTYQE